MKIFFLIHDDYAAGGLQRSTMAARECLAATGHEVRILCIRLEPGGLASRHDFVRELTPARSSRLRFWPALLRDLRRVVANERPNLIIGMGLTSSILLALATIGLRGPRIFGSERAYPPATPTPPVWRLLRRFALPRLDGIVCQTQRTADYYASQMGIAPAKLFVIPNVIDAPRAEPSSPTEELARYAGHPLVACVGRLEPQKGFDLALPIFAGILAERPEAQFVIVGDGTCEAELRAQADELGLAGKVLFLPSTVWLGAIWQQADIFLLTSRFEGIPNVLGEAMAHGIACVAFDCPTGPAELITEGEDGYLVALGDRDAAVRRCVELIDDQALRERLGAAARAVSSRFSAESICRLWNALAAGG